MTTMKSKSQKIALVLLVAFLSVTLSGCFRGGGIGDGGGLLGGGILGGGRGGGGVLGGGGEGFSGGSGG